MVDIKALFEQMKANNLQVVELIENSDVARSVDNFEAADAYLNGAVTLVRKNNEISDQINAEYERLLSQ